MHDFFNVILKSTAAIISSVALLFTGAPSPAAQQPSQPASAIVAVAPSAQDSGSMVSTPAPASATTAANDPAPVPVLPTKNAAPTSIFAPQPGAVAASPNIAAGLSKSYVDDQIQILRNSLSSEIFKYSSAQFPNAPGISQYTANLAVSQRIDQLTGTRLSNITVSGVSGLTTADIPTDITAENYLLLSGGALSGNLTTTGKVGIGTTSPFSTLDVYTSSGDGIGSISSAAPGSGSGGGMNVYVNTLPTSANQRLGTYNFGSYDGSTRYTNASIGAFSAEAWTSSARGSYLGFFTTNIGAASRTEKLRVDSSGNVGIGTTTPWGLLSVNANGLASGAPQFEVGSSTRTNFIVDNAGNVGIGTTSPRGKLDVYSSTAGLGILSISSATLGSASGGGVLTMASAMATAADQRLGLVSFGAWDGTNAVSPVAITGWSSEAWTVGASEGAHLRFETTAAGGSSRAEKMRITSAGNVGIGSTSPWGLLSINANGLSSSSPQFVVGSSTQTNFIVANNGKVGIGTTTPNASLDVWGWATLSRDGSAPHFDLFSYGETSQFKSYFSGRAASGSRASPAQLSSGDTITALYAYPYNGANFSSVGGGLEFYADGTQTSSSVPTAFRIQTAPSGSLSRLTRVTVDNAGNVGIGSTTPWGLLSVNATGLASSSPQFVVGSSTKTDFIVTNAGNVSIGTTTPNATFQVHKDSAQTIARISTGAQANALLSFVTDAYSSSSRGGGIGYDYTHNVMKITNNPATFANAQGLAIDAVANVGIGTTTPYAKLTLWGADTSAETKSFIVANSASTTLFAVSNDGNATLSGTLTQGSDRRLKENITPLGDSYGLAAMARLNPVSYGRIDQPGSATQLGFIAQEVQPILPELVSTSSATALTPDGTLTLNYINIIPAIVKAIQELLAQVNALASVVAGLAHELVTDRVVTKELCVTRSNGTLVCVTGDQLAALGEANSAAPSSSTTTPDTVGPVITLNGANPAQVEVGATYSDLGALVNDNIDQNLGYEVSLDNATSTEPSALVLNTSEPGTHTIVFSATDQAGNIGIATRTVIVGE